MGWAPSSGPGAGKGRAPSVHQPPPAAAVTPPPAGAAGRGESATLQNESDTHSKESDPHKKESDIGNYIYASKFHLMVILVSEIRFQASVLYLNRINWTLNITWVTILSF